MKYRRFTSFLLITSMLHFNIYQSIVYASNVGDPTIDSNATSFNALGAEVNPRTGQLQVSLKAPSLFGFFADKITPSISYTQSAVNSGHQMLGLPLGWSYKYSYIYNGYLFVDGKSSYQLDISSETGLRYYTLKNMKFQSNTLTFVNGDKYLFDLGGKLTRMEDRFGNGVHFMYDGREDIYHSKLSGIVDSFGQLTSFSYQNGITITYPKGGVNNISFSYKLDNRFLLTAYINPLQQTSFFSNNGGMSGNLIAKIVYPNGRCINVNYGVLPYLTDSSLNNISYLDSVSTYIESANGLIKTTQYNYNANGVLSNYTGYGKYSFSGADSLLESDDPSYFYYTAVDDGLLVTFHTYNHLHLETETGVWTRGHYLSIRETPDVSLTRYTYPGQNNNGIFISWKDLRTRFPNYQTPIQVTSYTYNDQGKRRENTVKTRFDNYANPVEMKTYESGTPISLLKLISNKVTVFDYGHYGLPIQETFYDYTQSPTTPIIIQSNSTITRNGLTIGKTIAMSTNGFVINGIFNPIKKIILTYDRLGRQIFKSLEWANGGQNPGISRTSHTTSYTYNPSSHTLTLINSDFSGNQTSTIIDATTGWKMSVRNPLGALNQYTYDNVGRIASKRDPLGGVITWSYITSKTLNKETKREANGYEGYTYFDGLGRQIKTSDNLDTQERVLTLTTYDALSQKVATEQGLLGDFSKVIYMYDTQGRPSSKKDALNNITNYIYDPVEQSTTIFFNGLKISKQIKGDLVLINTAYSTNSNAAYTIEKRLNASKQEVYRLKGSKSGTYWVEEILRYDEENKMIQKNVTGSDGIILTQEITRDLQGNITKTINTLNENATTIASSSTSDIDLYNELNQLISTTNTLNNSIIFEYDAAGRKNREVDYSRTIFTSSYNLMNQVTATSYMGRNGVTHETNYIYDPVTHQLISIIDKSNNIQIGKIDKTYDLEGKLICMTYPDGKKVSQSYNNNKGQINSLTDACGHVTSYSYDDYGRLQTISTTGGGDRLTYDYFSKAEDAASSGLLKSITYSNGIKKVYAYDGFQSLSSLSMMDTSAPSHANMLMQASYEYDSVTRNIKNIKYSSSVAPSDPKLNDTAVYTYNTLDQLVQEIAFGKTTSYQYDVASNIVKKTIVGSSVTSYTYDTDNRLKRMTSGSLVRDLSYDTNGNLINDGQGSLFIYNERDLLVGYSNGGHNVEYGYYPHQMRAFKKTKDQNDTIQFYYDFDENPNIINDIQGTQSASYLAKNEQKFVRYVKNGAAITCQYLIENKKDTLGLLGPDKKFQTSYQYNPYGGSSSGLIFSLSLLDNPFRYTREYTDLESGLVYLRARYYNANIERFISRDSYPLFNRYAYASGNPIMFIDPSGHMSWQQGLVLGGSIALVAGAIALTIFTAGAATPLAAVVAAGGLSGAGISGISFAAQNQDSNLTDNGGEDGKKLAIELGIGAGTGMVTGAATAGSGAYLASAAKAGASTGSLVAQGALIGGVSGGTIGLSSKMVSNASQGKTGADALDGWESAVTSGVVMGAIGGAMQGYGAHLDNVTEASQIDAKNASIDCLVEQKKMFRHLDARDYTKRNQFTYTRSVDIMSQKSRIFFDNKDTATIFATRSGVAGMALDLGSRFVEKSITG